MNYKTPRKEEEIIWRLKKKQHLNESQTSQT